MIKSPTKTQLSQELVKFMLDITMGTAACNPRLINIKEATVFVERCMAAGVRDHLDRCEELSIQHQKISVQPPQNRRDYGEQ